MKDIIKNNIVLSFTIIYLILFILGWILVRIFECYYLTSFKVFSLFIILIGFIYSTIKILKRNKRKFYVYIVYLTIEIIITFICLTIILLPWTGNSDSVVKKDGKLYVKVVHSFLSSNDIKYYDYINHIFRNNKLKIEECYDDTLNDNDYLYTLYYDDNGKVIKRLEK